MFKIPSDQIIKRNVDIHVPKDGSGSRVFPITVTFKVLPKSRNDELLQSVADAGNDDAWLNEVVMDFSGVIGADDQPLPFNADNLARLIDIPYVRVALINAYFETAAGGGRRKN